MDIFLLEQESRILRDKIAATASRTERLFAVIGFYKTICDCTPPTGFDPFIEEYYQIFKDTLTIFSAFSKPPDTSASLLKDLQYLSQCDIFAYYSEFITDNSVRIESELSLVAVIPQARSSESNGKSKIIFPASGRIFYE